MSLRPLLYLLPLLPLLSTISACDKQTRYAVLTTVFTGVPSMEELYGEELPEEKGKPEEPAITTEKTLFRHPLWTARQCTACHVDDADLEASLVEGASHESQGPGPGNDQVPALILPANKLCINCHRDKTARRAIRDRLWLHNPVARGDCLSCHTNHQSFNQAHLKQSLDKICSSCHVPGQLPRECLGQALKDPAQSNCFACHNAHMGRDRFLLSRDYIEVRIPADRPEAEPARP